jgi:3-oxoacyl-[acyl-carrier-protein] synthase-3
LLKEEGKGTSFLAIKAAQNLLEKANLDPKEIDLVIMATATPDMPVASTGVYVATEIGATNAFAFDLQAACSSFLYGMSTASAYITSGKYKKVLLIGADKMSSIIDYTDRATCIIFGDGAGAVLFEPNTEGLGLQDEILKSDGIGREFLKIEAGGSILPPTAETVKNKQHFVFQDGKTVFKYAVSGMADVSEQIMQRNNLTHDDVNWLVAHQANRRIIDATSNRMGVDESKVLINIQKYGNTTSATLPLLLSDFEQQLKKGDNIIFAAFGGGFTWGAIYLKWAYTK